MPSRDLDAEAARKERDEALAEWRKEATAELDAMTTVFDALHQLPRDSRLRALKWAEARLTNSPYYGEAPF